MTLKVNIYIFGLTKCTISYTVKYVAVFVPVFLYTFIVLIFQIKRIISSEKWFKYVITSFFYFFKNVKNLGRSDDAKRRKKKEDGLSN